MSTPIGWDDAEHDDSAVLAAAPRLFAVVRSGGDDGVDQVAAWGIAFDDAAELVSPSGGMRLRSDSPQAAAHLLSFATHTETRLLWV